MALLGLVNLYLLVHMAFAWHAANSENAEALAEQTVAMKTAEIAATAAARVWMRSWRRRPRMRTSFIKQRLPFANSEVVGELGALTKKQGVKLTRGQYAYAPVLAGDGG